MKLRPLRALNQIGEDSLVLIPATRTCLLSHCILANTICRQGMMVTRGSAALVLHMPDTSIVKTGQALDQELMGPGAKRGFRRSTACGIDVFILHGKGPHRLERKLRNHWTPHSLFQTRIRLTEEERPTESEGLFFPGFKIESSNSELARTLTWTGIKLMHEKRPAIDAADSFHDTASGVIEIKPEPAADAIEATPERATLGNGPHDGIEALTALINERTGRAVTPAIVRVEAVEFFEREFPNKVDFVPPREPKYYEFIYSGHVVKGMLVGRFMPHVLKSVRVFVPKLNQPMSVKKSPQPLFGRWRCIKKPF